MIEKLGGRKAKITAQQGKDLWAFEVFSRLANVIQLCFKSRRQC